MATKKFVCKVCGYVHEGAEAPEKCPVCGVPASQFEEVKENKKKGFDTTSNSYAIIYAAVVVVIVAFLLATVSSVLKPMQDANVALDKKKQILSALNIRNVKDVEATYSQVVKEEAIINSKGEEIANKGAFEIANDKISADNLPLYICDVDGQVKYVIPVVGQGLWGGIWGYVGLDADKNTIYGIYFSHQSETPGLGAEIASEKFTNRFLGKEISKNGTVVISVVKGKLSDEKTQVNSVSGATITSDGVDRMLKESLSDYQAFMQAKTNEN